MGVLPNTKFSTYDSYTAYTMVEAGLGVTLTSALLASTWSGNVKTVPLDPPQTINIGVAIPTEDAISPAAKSFMELAVKYLT